MMRRIVRQFSTSAKPPRFDYTLNPKSFPVIHPPASQSVTHSNNQSNNQSNNRPQQFSSQRTGYQSHTQPYRSSQSTNQSFQSTSQSANQSSKQPDNRPKVKIVEVGPRDGLQNEKSSITPEIKSELIFRLVQSGLSLIEAASFVSPKWVPQMADSPQVMELVRKSIKQQPINQSFNQSYQSLQVKMPNLDLGSVSLPIHRLPNEFVHLTHQSNYHSNNHSARALHTRSINQPINLPTNQSSNQIPYPRFAALTPNLQGYESALKSKVDEVAVFASASETFSQANINCSIQQSIERFLSLIERAKHDHMPVRGYVSCVIGCPYEGWIEPSSVYGVVKQLLDLGCYEVSLGDTIGVGTPGSTSQLIDYLLKRGIPRTKLAVHFHDTYGQALSNIHTALGFGIDTLDSAVAGLGGCPYAAGASGNVATEDVVYSLESSGYSTGVDLIRLIETAHWISAQLGKEPSSKVAKAVKASQDSASCV